MDTRATHFITRSAPKHCVAKRLFYSSVTLMLGLSLGSVSIANEHAEEGIDRGIISNFMQETQQTSEVQLQLPEIPGNIALTTQVGNSNTARIQQGPDSPNLAAIYQYGHGNDANIIQDGNHNIGVVIQHGSELQANLHQQGHEFGAEINQVGIRGQVNLSQSGSGYRSISIDQITRSGAGATATIVTN